MLEQLNIVIGKRVKEVLQFHLNGTSEEFDAAAIAVIKELTSIGGNLHTAIESNTGGLGSLSLSNPEGREQLAEQLTQALTDEESDN